MSEENENNDVVQGPAIEKIQLAELEATQLELARERTVNAEMVLKLRRGEFQALVDATVRNYSEGGKFTVITLDTPQGVLERIAAK